MILVASGALDKLHGSVGSDMHFNNFVLYFSSCDASGQYAADRSPLQYTF